MVRFIHHDKKIHFKKLQKLQKLQKVANVGNACPMSNKSV